MEGPRGVKPEEFQEMLELVKLVFRADLGQRVPLLYRHNDLENLRILKEDGKIVTHIGISTKDVSILGCKTRVGNIGSVCTHPDYRQQNFATVALNDTIRKLEADGVTVMSVSGGRGLYQRAGCRSVGTHLNFTIDSAAIQNLPVSYAVEVVPYEEKRYLKEIASLYEREPIRFWRPLEDFQTIFSRRDVLTIHKAGQCVGYVVVNIRQKENSEEMRCHIAEFAGSRIAILSAAKLLFEKHDLVELTFGTSPHDTELLSILSEMGLEPKISTLGNTTRIINLPLLMEHFRPHIAQRLPTKVTAQLKVGKEDGKHIFQLGDEKFFVAEEHSLVQMIFGTPDNVEQELMPKEGKLAEVLRDILPLPFVWPGLNNV